MILEERGRLISCLFLFALKKTGDDIIRRTVYDNSEMASKKDKKIKGDQDKKEKAPGELRTWFTSGGMFFSKRNHQGQQKSGSFSYRRKDRSLLYCSAIVAEGIRTHKK